MNKNFIILTMLTGALCLFSGCEQSDVKKLRSRAKQGDAKAQIDLGRHYAGYYGATPNYKTAARWFRKAAEQGDAEGQHCLGVSYMFGKGVPKNYDEAILWLQKAGEQGYSFAFVFLGASHYQLKNYEEAILWNKRAIGHNDSDTKAWGYENYAWLLATCPDDQCRDGDRALDFAKKAESLLPEEAEVIGTLAAAYAEVDQFEIAIETQKRAISLLKKTAESHEREEMDNCLYSYEKHQPWRGSRETYQLK